MAKLVVLGTASAVPDERHDNTHLTLLGEDRNVLIDCASNPHLSLRKAGVDPQKITDLILTHFHPDHVSGLAPYLMSMWLTGRTLPLRIYGLAHTLERAADMMKLYGWEQWPNFYPVIFHELNDTPMTLVFKNEEFIIYSSPVKHFIPTIGLRVEFLKTGKVLAYSCDTEPCPEVLGLASQANVLFHEVAVCTDDGRVKFEGHSSAYQAGEQAQQAGVETLYLIHYTGDCVLSYSLISQARLTFNGNVDLAEDMMELEF